LSPRQLFDCIAAIYAQTIELSVKLQPAQQLHFPKHSSHFIVRAQLSSSGRLRQPQNRQKAVTQSPETKAPRERRHVSRATEEEP
jgi:hypothetical protein